MTLPFCARVAPSVEPAAMLVNTATPIATARSGLLRAMSLMHRNLRGFQETTIFSDYPGVSIAAVGALVLANGFFVAAEFSLVAVRRSRVAELVAQGRMNAGALSRAVDQLDAYLAATQLGITIASLALGWIGEPALAQLIEPLLAGLVREFANVGAHALAVATAFTIITALHIVLGELAPKSLALQRSEQTALIVVRPLGLFLLIFRPAILFLNGLGNGVLRLAGLRPGAGEEALHSPEEIKMLIAASREGGLVEEAQQTVVQRVLSIGDRRIGDIMTPRLEVQWIDADDERNEILKTVRQCHHDQILVSRGSIDEIIGVVRKQDLLDQLLDEAPLDPFLVMYEALIVHETASILAVLERFKAQPVRMAVVVDEYGSFEGIVTQTDLLEAIAGDLPETGKDEPKVLVQENKSLLMDGLLRADDAFERLGMEPAPKGDFHTLAGFVLEHLKRIPKVGNAFTYRGWHFEVAAMDGRRIDKVLVRPADPSE